jgi:hypothetical protein
MSELDFPGWELTQMPEDAAQISTTWINYFANGDALEPSQIQSIVDRALLHQELLSEVINRGG